MDYAKSWVCPKDKRTKKMFIIELGNERFRANGCDDYSGDRQCHECVLQAINDFRDSLTLRGHKKSAQ